MTQVQYPSRLVGDAASDWENDDSSLAHLRLPPRTPSPKPATKPLSKLSSISIDANHSPPPPAAFDADAFLAGAEARAKARLEKATLAHAQKREQEERDAAEKALTAKQAYYEEERDEFFSPLASNAVDEDAAADAFDNISDKRSVDALSQSLDFDADLEYAESKRVLDARGEEIRRQMSELAEEEAALSKLVAADAFARRELERRLELASRARLVLSTLLEIMANGTEDPELQRLLRKTGLEGKPRLPRLLRSFMHSRSSEEIDADLASLLRSFACSPPPPPRRRRKVVRSTSDLRVELLRKATTTPRDPSPPDSETPVPALPPKPLLSAPPLDP